MISQEYRPVICFLVFLVFLYFCLIRKQSGDRPRIYLEDSLVQAPHTSCGCQIFVFTKTEIKIKEGSIFKYFIMLLLVCSNRNLFTYIKYFCLKLLNENQFPIYLLSNQQQGKRYTHSMYSFLLLEFLLGTTKNIWLFIDVLNDKTRSKS